MSEITLSTTYLCVVNTHEMRVWTICTPETAAQELENAERYAAEQIARIEDLNQHHPDNPVFGAMLTNARNARYSLMTYGEFLALEREKLLGGAPEEIDEETFNDQLNVLPPLKWCTIDGIEMFCMLEMYTGSYTAQYAYDRKTGKFWSKVVDALDPETWIHKALNTAE